MSILELLRDPLQDMIESIEPRFYAKPLPLKCDSYVARSIFQKAIRRGMIPLALRAAATVSSFDPKIAWRRLLVTLLEDIGTERVDLVIRVAAVLEQRRFGLRLHDDWPFLSNIVEASCRAAKCQAANDLHNLSLHDPAFAPLRNSMAEGSPSTLLQIASDRSRSLVERNIAILTSLGRRHAYWTAEEGIDREVLVDAITADSSAAAALIYGWALRRSGLPLATASILLSERDREVDGCRREIAEVLPPTRYLGDIPAFALDQYTLIGRSALRDFVRQSSRWRDMVSPLNLSRARECQAANELSFRIESAAVDRRRNWLTGAELAKKSRTVGCFLPTEFVDGGLDIIRSEIPMLNTLREQRLIEAT